MRTMKWVIIFFVFGCLILSICSCSSVSLKEHRLSLELQKCRIAYELKALQFEDLKHHYNKIVDPSGTIIYDGETDAIDGIFDCCSEEL